MWGWIPGRLVAAALLVLNGLLLNVFILIQESGKMTRVALSRQIDPLDQSTGARVVNSFAAVRFDVDLIVAINEYCFAVGNSVVNLAKKMVAEEAGGLRGQGRSVHIMPYGEGDDINVFMPGATVDEVTDFANRVRIRVKNGLRSLANYQGARAFVCQRLNNPPLSPEEQQNVGTVSAGVALLSRGSEALLSDVASAVKEAKFRGRNKTVVYRAGDQKLVID